MPDRGPSRALHPDRTPCTTLKCFHQAKTDFHQTEAHSARQPYGPITPGDRRHPDSHPDRHPLTGEYAAAPGGPPARPRTGHPPDRPVNC